MIFLFKKEGDFFLSSIQPWFSGGVAMRFGMYLFLTGNKFTNGTCSCHCCQIEARQSFFPLFLSSDWHWLTSVFLPQVIWKYYKTICFNQSLTYFQQLQPFQTHVPKVFFNTTLPPIIIDIFKEWVPPIEISYLSNTTILHVHNYGWNSIHKHFTHPQLLPRTILHPRRFEAGGMAFHRHGHFTEACQNFHSIRP